jgi:hypothetical protein
MLWVYEPIHDSPPFGETTVIEGDGEIVKTLLLLSVTAAFVVSVILIRQFVDVVLGITHEYEPPEATDAVITVYVEPLSKEYSILILLTLKLVHVILCAVPAIQFSPPFGEVTVIEGGGEIVKTELLTSVSNSVVVPVILMRQFVDGLLGIVHVYEPKLWLMSDAISVQLVPLFEENSIFKFPVFELVQVILWNVPAIHDSPPLGDDKVMEAIVKTRSLLSV